MSYLLNSYVKSLPSCIIKILVEFLVFLYTCMYLLYVGPSDPRGSRKSGNPYSDAGIPQAMYLIESGVSYAGMFRRTTYKPALLFIHP